MITYLLLAMLSVSVYLNFILVKKIDVYESTIFSFYRSVEEILVSAREIDNRQMFEKDDEVGSLFQQLLDIIGDLRHLIYDESEET